MKKVSEQQKSGIKFLGYGATGTGKTLFGLSAPAIASMDTEDGQVFYMRHPVLGKNLLYREVTNSVKDVEDVLDEVENDLIEEVKTLLIDSETKLYENLQHVQLNIAEERARKAKRDSDAEGLSVKEWGKIKQVTKRIQNSKIILASKGINIISIAQESDLKEKSGENWVVIGHKPEVAKGLEFDYDVILRFFTKDVMEKGKKLVKYFAEVIKDRTNTYQKGDIVENPNFDLWGKAYAIGQGGVEGKLNFRDSETKDIEVFSSQEKIDNIVKQIKSMVGDPVKMAILSELAKSGKIPKDFLFANVEQAQAILDELV